MSDRSMHAALYVGEVMHRRTRPRAYAFAYRVFLLHADIDRLPAAAAACRLLSVNRFNLFSFHDRDHGPRDGTPLRPWVERHLAAAGLDDAGARIRVLCLPRVLGYVFNPLTVYFCHDADDRLGAVLYEVKNTFGDQHGYLLPVDPERRGPADHGADKVFHVSPFIGMNARYRFRVAPPEDTLALLIRESDDDGEFLIASLTGRRRTLNDGALLGLFFRLPLMTVKVIAAIHWHGLKLALRGVRFRRRPPPPAHDVTLPPVPPPGGNPA